MTISVTAKLYKLHISGSVCTTPLWKAFVGVFANVAKAISLMTDQYTIVTRRFNGEISSKRT